MRSPPPPKDATPAFLPRTLVVTGATSGIGLAAAAALRPRVETLVLVGRDPEKLDRVERTLRASAGSGAVRCYLADLSRLADVRRLAADLARDHASIDVLLNNAGAYFARREVTDEGIERTLALNVLQPYLLTRLLRTSLRAAGRARVVNVASAAHRGAGPHLEDFDRRARYAGFRVYGRSKLELILLTHEFARRWAEDRIDVNALHPGLVRTAFGRNNGGAVGAGLRLATALFGISPRNGARTAVHLATSPAVEGLTGEYFVRCRAVRSSRASYDEAAARTLWDLCSERVGLPASE